MKEISAKDLKALMDSKEDFQLIDVREQKEFDFSNIGGELIPLNTVPDNLDKISKDKKVVVHCRSGARSANAIQYLEQHGFTDLFNLKGGILAWSDDVDPKVKKY